MAGGTSATQSAAVSLKAVSHGQQTSLPLNAASTGPVESTALQKYPAATTFPQGHQHRQVQEQYPATKLHMSHTDLAR